MDNIFELKYSHGDVIIEKDGKRLSIKKYPDGDIWFNTANNDIDLIINSYSSNQEEWRSYIIFENLMKSIVGRYVLSGDNKDEYSCLPKDFIDLENKTITWHSDSGRDNILQLQFDGEKITISIIKDKNVNDKNSNNAIKVRIRTNGSDYGNYYREFIKFFDELSSFIYKVDSMKTQNVTTTEMQPVIQRKLSLFRNLKK